MGDIGANHYIQMINSTGVAIYDKTTRHPITSFDLTALGGCATGPATPLSSMTTTQTAGCSASSAPATKPDRLHLPKRRSAGTYARFPSTPAFPTTSPNTVSVRCLLRPLPENSPSAPETNRPVPGRRASCVTLLFPAQRLQLQAPHPRRWDGATRPSPVAQLLHATATPGSPRPQRLPHRGTSLGNLWPSTSTGSPPANSSFTQVGNIAISEFGSSLCGLHLLLRYRHAWRFQITSTSALDPLREVIMFRLQYRNFGSHQTLVGKPGTDVTGNDDAGVLPGSNCAKWVPVPGPLPEGRHLPTPSHRWMGPSPWTAAVTSPWAAIQRTVYPSLRYTGRLASDHWGTMPQGENMGISGSASNGGNRYGRLRRHERGPGR